MITCYLLKFSQDHQLTMYWYIVIIWWLSVSIGLESMENGHSHPMALHARDRHLGWIKAPYRPLAWALPSKRVTASLLTSCVGIIIWSKTVSEPPLNIFWGSSRPIRGHDFWLWTNQMPHFQQDFQLPLDVKPGNPPPAWALPSNRTPIWLRYTLKTDTEVESEPLIDLWHGHSHLLALPSNGTTR